MLPYHYTDLPFGQIGVFVWSKSLKNKGSFVKFREKREKLLSFLCFFLTNHKKTSILLGYGKKVSLPGYTQSINLRFSGDALNKFPRLPYNRHMECYPCAKAAF